MNMHVYQKSKMTNDHQWLEIEVIQLLQLKKLEVPLLGNSEVGEFLYECVCNHWLNITLFTKQQDLCVINNITKVHHPLKICTTKTCICFVHTWFRSLCTGSVCQSVRLYNGCKCRLRYHWCRLKWTPFAFFGLMYCGVF